MLVARRAFTDLARPPLSENNERLSFVQNTSWEQAIQWLPAKAIQKGSVMMFEAKHDTYSMSFSYYGMPEEKGMVSPILIQSQFAQINL